MAFKYNGNDDNDDELTEQTERPELPEQPQPTPRSHPTSAPAVPKELLSARPAMTRVVPRSPEKMAQLQQARQAAARPQQSQAAQPTPEEMAERQERLEYLRSLRNKEQRPKRGGGKKWLIALVVILVLAALGGGAYWFLHKPTKPVATTTQQQPSTQKQQVATNAPSDTSPTAQMKDYQSTSFPISLKYPANWTVSDTAQKLTITSPQQNLPGAAGGQESGQVVFMIRPKQASLAEFKTGNASAVLESKKLNYSSPAAGQRGSTYISYLQYAATTTKGALDAIYVTGNAGYQKGQYVPQTDVVKVDPLITVSFVQCSAGAACALNAPAMSVQADSFNNSDLEKTVEAIIQSLAISG